MGAFGGLGQLPGGLSQQGLVRRDDRLAVLKCGQDGLARGFDRTHQLHHDVDVGPGDQFLDVLGEQRRRYRAVTGDAPDRDTAQFQWRADARGQVGGTGLDDPHHLAADVAQSEHRDADRLVHVFTSRLSRSSTVSRRSTSRDRPSRTATTAGRPIRL